jgi:dTMP kinase
MQGKFITFEGGEGAGKSLQIKRFAEYLKSKGIDVVLTREPGGTEVGKEIRKILVEGDKDKFDEITEILLFYADRRINLEKVVKPALLEGKYVISDRYNDSTIAYQYYGANKFSDTKIMDTIYDVIAGDFKPDLTVLLDVDVKVGLERSFKKAEGMEIKELRFENAKVDFHQRLRNGYLEMAKNEPERFVVVNANNGIDEVFDELIKKIEGRI